MIRRVRVITEPAGRAEALAAPPPALAAAWGREGPPIGVTASRPATYLPACTQSVIVMVPLPSSNAPPLTRGAQSTLWNSEGSTVDSSPATKRPTITQSEMVTLPL